MDGGRPAEAISSYEAAASTSPPTCLAFNGLSNAYEGEARFEEARDRLAGWAERGFTADSGVRTFYETPGDTERANAVVGLASTAARLSISASSRASSRERTASRERVPSRERASSRERVPSRERAPARRLPPHNYICAYLYLYYTFIYIYIYIYIYIFMYIHA